MELPATKSEELVARLCRKTFLKLWSHPRVFRNQGTRGGRKEGKEVCDLLIVCGDDILIFSIKECGYKNTGRVEIDWPRWYDRAIRQSVKQLSGAERWIREHPDRLFLDRRCSQRFPIRVPRSGSVRIHRILVALGSRNACREFRGGNPALRIYPALKADEHTNPAVASTSAFAVGDVSPHLGWTHVLDDESLGIVLNELDTITDFVTYLRKKEALINEGNLVYSASEADLLSVYLSRTNEDEFHDFFSAGSPREPISVEDGSWDRLITTVGYARKKEADQQSYLWDGIIDRFGEHALCGTLASGDLASVEVGVRIMAQEARTPRRSLSYAIGQLVMTSPEDMVARRYVLPYSDQTLGYVFMSFPHREPENFNREQRRQLLCNCCFVFACRQRQLKRVIGIATESDISREFRSEDLVLFESPNEWSAEEITSANEMSAEFHILQPSRVTPRYYHDDDYQLGEGPNGPPEPVRDWWKKLGLRFDAKGVGGQKANPK